MANEIVTHSDLDIFVWYICIGQHFFPVDRLSYYTIQAVLHDTVSHLAKRAKHRMLYKIM